MQEHNEIRLFVAPDVRAELEQRRLGDAEIQKTIAAAEGSGKKFVHPATGHFLAGTRQNTVTVWVEYTPREDGFEIFKAYQYRLEIHSWDLGKGQTRGD